MAASSSDRADRLIARLEAKYRKVTRKSFALYRQAEKVMIRGGSHNLRLWRPYPFIMAEAHGPYVVDVDGNRYIDYWQGHYANILGHNPSVLKKDLAAFDPEHGSLHTGFEGESQIRLAEILLRRLGYSDFKVRFTTSGTLATMYAVMLAQAYTGRDHVLKIGGGWHGASPYLLKGVKYEPGAGFVKGESAGVPPELLRRTLIARFGDAEGLAGILAAKGSRIACFILEPFLGVGGFLPASAEYLRSARELTERYGVLLIFDEIISGFRFCPSGVQSLYGIEPDLATFGKLIGGGHAVSAVAGRTDILAGKPRGAAAAVKVLFEGGTFSAHPQYMRAGTVMLRHLVENAEAIYPRLARAGEEIRTRIEGAFRSEGIEAVCTGRGNDVVTGSSLYQVNFPRTRKPLRTAEDLWNPDVSDVRLKEEILKLALLTEGVHVVHGGGAVSAAHDDSHLDETVEAYARVARLVRRALF
jgi:glutamate-1-semialdehyde 2,1-aminomutase